ncbi:MAG: TRAP transporter large permease subunit [Deltaproteobacteria bacterium]|nr:TRAP transporter large permease subunit [Deltaproteobacteria bacterium]
MSPEFVTIGMFVGLLIGLLMGHPLPFVLGGLATIFGYLGWGPSCFYLFLNQIWGTMDNYILVCIPLFILMAQLLDQSGVAEDLFDTMRYLFGPVRGGLAIAVVVVATLFGACTGIIGASVVTMGLLAMPVFLKYGYNKRLASGAICAGGTLGILIPPSIMLVVMADQAALSVGKLFAGALIPGIILSTLYIIYILIRCWFKPQDGPALSKEERAAVSSMALFLRVLKSMVPPMVLVLGVLGSIFAGIATPTEAAGIGVLLTLIMTVAYGKFTWIGLKTAVMNTTRTTSMVIIILAFASCFSAVFMGCGGGDVVKSFIYGIGFGKWGTFIVMMIILFFLGMFLDWIGIVMITFPLFLPIAQDLGFDKVWFVVIMAVMLQDSFLTPPFGYALFYLRGVAPPEVTTGDIYWGAFPFWRLMELGLIACIIWPQTILWLANTLVR